MDSFLIAGLFLFPLLTRYVLCKRFKEYCFDTSLSEEEQDTNSHRSIYLALLAISYSGLLAMLLVSEAWDGKDYHQPAFAQLLSFIAYFVAISIQSYKLSPFQDQMGEGFVDSGNLCLFLSLILVLLEADTIDCSTLMLFGFVISATWLIDFLHRVSLDYKFFKAEVG